MSEFATAIADFVFSTFAVAFMLWLAWFLIKTD
jgi:hypothetical protein